MKPDNFLEANQDKIEKEVYYNNYDKNGEERITICLIRDKHNNAARGVTACSYDDEFDAEEGKKWSKIFALMALNEMKLEPITDKRIIEILIDSWCPFTKKGERNPELSWYERKLLFGWKKMGYYKSGIGFVLPLKNVVIDLSNYGNSPIYIDKKDRRKLISK